MGSCPQATRPPSTTYRGEIIGAAVDSGFPAPYANFAASSEGALELCRGEADDVLNLPSAVTAMPDADADHVGPFALRLHYRARD
jgi:hypothetical protein